MLTLGYLVISVLLIFVYPWVCSDVSVVHLCLSLGIRYLVILVLLSCAYSWVSNDVSVAHLCLPLGI